jgi:hypothetical protein
MIFLFFSYIMSKCPPNEEEKKSQDGIKRVEKKDAW